MAQSSPMNNAGARSGGIADRPRVRYGGDNTNTVNASGQTRIGGQSRLVDAQGSPLGGSSTTGPSMSGAPAAAGSSAPAPMQPPKPSGQLVPGRSTGSMVWQPSTPQPEAGGPAASPNAYPGSRAKGPPAASPAAAGSPPQPLPDSSSPAPAPSPAPGGPVGSPSSPLTPSQMRDRAAQQAASPAGGPAPMSPPPAAGPKKSFEGYPSLASWKAAQEKQRAPLTASTPSPSGPIRIDPTRPQPTPPPAPGAKNIDGHPSMEAWRTAHAAEQSAAANRARAKLAGQPAPSPAVASAPVSPAPGATSTPVPAPAQATPAAGPAAPAPIQPPASSAASRAQGSNQQVPPPLKQHASLSPTLKNTPAPLTPQQMRQRAMPQDTPSVAAAPSSASSLSIPDVKSLIHPPLTLSPQENRERRQQLAGMGESPGPNGAPGKAPPLTPMQMRARSLFQAANPQAPPQAIQPPKLTATSSKPRSAFMKIRPQPLMA